MSNSPIFTDNKCTERYSQSLNYFGKVASESVTGREVRSDVKCRQLPFPQQSLNHAVPKYWPGWGWYWQRKGFHPILTRIREITQTNTGVENCKTEQQNTKFHIYYSWIYSSMYIFALSKRLAVHFNLSFKSQKYFFGSSLWWCLCGSL